MSRFEKMISIRPGEILFQLIWSCSQPPFLDEISSEVFDILASCGDFVEFKDMILDYKRQRAASQSRKGSLLDLSLTGKHLSSP